MKRFLCAFAFTLTTYGMLFCQDLDETFANNGILKIQASEGSLFPADMAIDVQNQCMYLQTRTCVGRTPDRCDSVITVQKLSSDGEIDSNFGENGAVRVPLQGDERGGNVLSLANGGFLVITRASQLFLVSRATIFRIIKFTQDGTLDSQFGESGILDLKAVYPEYDIRSIAEGANSTFYLVAMEEESDQRYMMRYNSLGEPDNSFGTEGVKALPDSPLDGFYMIYDDVTSHIYLGATENRLRGSGGSNNFYQIEKYNQEGELDTSFGSDGVYTTSFRLLGLITSELNEPPLLLLFGERVVINGPSNNTKPDNSLASDCLIAVDKFSGVIDSSFGTNGVVYDHKGTAQPLVLNSEQFVTMGGEPIGSNFVFNLFQANGSLDSSFADNGSLRTTLFESDTVISASGLQGPGLLDGDGKIVVPGVVYTPNNTYQTIIVRYAQNVTSLDESVVAREQLLYPNPTQNTLHLPQELSTQNLRLCNSQGQQFNVVQPNENQLDVSQLAPGMYVLQAGERVWRFVKE